MGAHGILHLVNSFYMERRDSINEEISKDISYSSRSPNYQHWRICLLHI